MGLYLNPGNEQFRKAVRADIFIDKSMMISKLNHIFDTENNYVCVSRPRRFGKSMAGNMIAAYYSKGCDVLNFLQLGLMMITHCLQARATQIWH